MVNPYSRVIPGIFTKSGMFTLVNFSHFLHIDQYLFRYDLINIEIKINVP